ncbi:hypothetical protein SEVIR_9G472901v4 [Setaria viridis]
MAQESRFSTVVKAAWPKATSVSSRAKRAAGHVGPELPHLVAAIEAARRQELRGAHLAQGEPAHGVIAVHARAGGVQDGAHREGGVVELQNVAGGVREGGDERGDRAQAERHGRIVAREGAVRVGVEVQEVGAGCCRRRRRGAGRRRRGWRMLRRQEGAPCLHGKRRSTCRLLGDVLLRRPYVRVTVW